MKAMKGKAMKLMKAMQSMKAMKVKKVSQIAKGAHMRASVFFGNKNRTYTGLKKSDLMKSKSGKIVTRKSHNAGKKAYANIKKWTAAVQKARKELRVKGFVPVKKGSPLYKAAKAHMSA